MKQNNQFFEDVNLDHEIDLMEIFSVVKAGKKLIGLITGFTALASLIVALSLPNIYTSSALLAPAEQSGGGMSGLMKQYSGLASLAGVSLPSMEEGSRAQLGIQLMQSRAFIGEFLERRKLLPELMAIDSYDVESGNVTFNKGIYDASENKWVRRVELPYKPKPSLLESHHAFTEILSVSEDNQNGFVTVSIEHKSPIIAAKWVNWLVEDINSTMRNQDIEEATKSIEYLKQQVSDTALTDLQVLFFELIQSQTETIMLANVRPEYVFKTIDPAVISEEKSKPRRLLIFFMGLMLGAALGIVTVIVLHYSKHNN